MTSLPPDTRERLGKLIPRLGSDQDGEVVATVRAIERTLKSADRDLHALADLITGTRTGWAPPGARRAATPQSGQFNYANAYKETEPLFEGPEHPEAQTRKFGLAIYSADRIDPWHEVARHCLRLNRTVPKKHGGKMLEDWQKAFLRTLIDDGRQPSNRHVEMLERVVARLHQARDAAARAAS